MSIDNLHYGLNFNPSETKGLECFTTAGKSVLVLVKFSSFVSQCCKIRKITLNFAFLTRLGNFNNYKLRFRFSSYSERFRSSCLDQI